MQLTSDTKQLRWMDKNLPLDLHSYMQHMISNLLEQCLFQIVGILQ